MHLSMKNTNDSWLRALLTGSWRRALHQRRYPGV